MQRTTDFLVIGSGVAGLSFALEASEHGSVIVVSKRDAEESNTKWAQGGIAAVLDATDTFEAHVEDTLIAGASLNHRETVKICVEEGPERIRMLLELGAKFDTAKTAKPEDSALGKLDLHLEGGHSARRIVHAADMTGREVERALLEAVRARPNVLLLKNTWRSTS